jgi:hypothetical protein
MSRMDTGEVINRPKKQVGAQRSVLWPRGANGGQGGSGHSAVAQVTWPLTGPKIKPPSGIRRDSIQQLLRTRLGLELDWSKVLAFDRESWCLGVWRN